jgi:hypothetical protein
VSEGFGFAAGSMPFFLGSPAAGAGQAGRSAGVVALDGFPEGFDAVTGGLVGVALSEVVEAKVAL